MNPKLLISFICVLSVLFSGCRKESDTRSPSVTVFQPLKGSIYSVYDTILISALISDESKLESVKISLLDAEQKPVLSSLIFTPTTSQYNLNSGLPIDDIHLVGGVYTLQVKAFDGTNFTNTYLDIQINEIPKELKSVIVVSRGGIYGTEISAFNEDGEWKKVLSLNGDYNVSDISSYSQIIYTAGALSGNLNATSLPAGPVVWQIPLVASPPYRYFEDVLCSWPLLYVAYYNGSIYGYDKNGMVLFSTNIQAGYFPGKLGIVNNLLLASMQSKTGNASLLTAYYMASGSIMQSVNIPVDVVAFEYEDNNRVLVFGNDANSGKIMEYTVSQNYLRLLYDFPERIFAIARKDDNNFFVAGGQAVHWYIRPTNTLVEYLHGTPSALIDFDVVNDRLFALSDHNLSAYDMFSGLSVLSISVADSALALHLLYNK
jgi:hypothetical protein